MSAVFDNDAVRDEFPVTRRMVYLDSAHQAPLATSIRAALDDFHAEAQETAGPKPIWLQRVERTRARVAALLAARPDEIAFTKNTSEGLNIAANAVPLQPDDEVLLIDGDPLADISVLQKPDRMLAIMKGGVFVKAPMVENVRLMRRPIPA